MPGCFVDSMLRVSLVTDRCAVCAHYLVSKSVLVGLNRYSTRRYVKVAERRVYYKSYSISSKRYCLSFALYRLSIVRFYFYVIRTLPS